jgi:hypothetical protein
MIIKKSYHEETLSDEIAQAIYINWKGITRGSRSCKKFWHSFIPSPWRNLQGRAILRIITTREAKVDKIILDRHLSTSGTHFQFAREITSLDKLVWVRRKLIQRQRVRHNVVKFAVTNTEEVRNSNH